MTRFALLAFVILFGSGCSSFHTKWKNALAQPVPANDISGPWEGRWVSDKNGHTGRLRCVLTEQTPGQYQAHFHAVFWKIFRAAYEVPFAVTNDQQQFVFSGQADLGKLAGGFYTYEGKATAREFHSTYKNKYDHGRFEMARPEGSK